MLPGSGLALSLSYTAWDLFGSYRMVWIVETSTRPLGLLCYTESVTNNFFLDSENEVVKCSAAQMKHTLCMWWNMSFSRIWEKLFWRTLLWFPEYVQWSAVRVTAVTLTVCYSDSFGNPRFITNKTPLLTVTKNRLQWHLLPNFSVS